MKKGYNKLMACIFAAGVLGLVAAAWAASERGGDRSAREDSWDTYRVIVERNMFSRQRGVRRERFTSEERRPLPPVPNPESYYVLKGIVQEDSVFTAFIEDTQRGGVLRVGKGDKVARGEVKAISLDSIEYQLGEKTITVTLGLDLEGGQGTVSLASLIEGVQASSPPSTSEGPGESTGAPASADEADILRQLMQRRQQQVGQ